MKKKNPMKATPKTMPKTKGKTMTSEQLAKRKKSMISNAATKAMGRNY